MNEVWFGPGLTTADWEGFLKALSLHDTSATPLLAVATGGDDFRLVVASRALFDLFDVSTSEALSTRLIGGGDPGARRLAVLFRTLALGGAPRLERLRFFLGPGSEIITFLCRRITMQDGRPVFIAAALGLRADLIPANTMRVSAAIAPTLLHDTSLPPTALIAVPPRSVEEADAEMRRLWPSNKTVRFLWRTDANGICTALTPTLRDIVGPINSDLVDRDLVALAPIIDPSEALGQALKSRATWSGLQVAWPLDGGAGIATSLGAVPACSDDGSFAGYSGYGVIHPRRLTARDWAPLPLRLEQASAEKVANHVQDRSGRLEFSHADQKAFDDLGAELRQEAQLVDSPTVVTSEPDNAAPPASHPVPATGREGDIARNGLAILEGLSTGLLVSRDNVPIFANRHLLDMLGFADEDALHAVGGMDHLFEGDLGNSTGSEVVGIRGRDGSVVHTSTHMRRIVWDGLPATLLTIKKTLPLPVTGHSVDQVLETEQDKPARREDSEARELRAILETATDGVVVIGAFCEVLSLNRSAEALFGCDRDTVTGKPFADLFAPANQNLVIDYIDGVKSNATKSLLNDGREFLVKAPQGGTIPVFMTLGRLDAALAGPHASATPAAVRFCALFRDLTHWKKVEQDLEAAKQAAERTSALKSDFLAKVSHEVRTPLNAIIGFAEVIMEERFGPVGNERYKDYLRDIHASGTHVMSLVNDLLDLSKIEAGKMDLTVAAVDANKIISECVALMQPQASRERVIMRLSLAPGLRHIAADERSLRQIVLNLLSNAVKFNEPGGQVIVATATTEDGKVLIRIRDTGPGMSEADIAAALEPFRQLSTSRPTVGGTGLGLPLTKALVEANHASFTIKSKLDHGTLVEVAFSARALASERNDGA